MCILIREIFIDFQVDSMKHYIDNGGSILLTLNEGGETKSMTNINIFLKSYGIQVNDGNH
jgi:intraflagellar transport protein 52